MHAGKTLDFLWYGFALAVTVLQTGYIQPDEFFQNPEITAGDIFNISHFRPWEFRPENGLRAVSVPFITSGLPFLLLRLLEKTLHFKAGANLLLLLPRLAMFFLLPFLEIILYSLAMNLGVSRRSVKHVFRTSYITFVFLPRTFSNSVEVFLFAALLNLVTQLNASRSSGLLAASIAGFVSALGVFNRPTFLAFGVVPWIYFLSRSNLRGILVGTLSGIVASCLSIGIDSCYYGRFVITPLQFILYNIDPKNNAAHGIHPRYFHLFVSLPQLFGPLLFCIFRPAVVRLHQEQKLLVLAFVVPLAMISIIPHQEPRFLLALAIPLFLLTAQQPETSRKTYVLWIIFNLLAGIFFGFFHQGGVPASLSVVRDLLERDPTVKVFYYKTYIPPFYPLRLPHSEVDRVVDLGLSKLEAASVGPWLRRGSSGLVFFLTPATHALERFGMENVTALLHRRFCPHWSFEAQVENIIGYADPWQFCLNMWMLSFERSVE